MVWKCWFRISAQHRELHLPACFHFFLSNWGTSPQRRITSQTLKISSHPIPHFKNPVQSQTSKISSHPIPSHPKEHSASKKNLHHISVNGLRSEVVQSCKAFSRRTVYPFETSKISQMSYRSPKVEKRNEKGVWRLQASLRYTQRLPLRLGVIISKILFFWRHFQVPFLDNRDCLSSLWCYFSESTGYEIKFMYLACSSTIQSCRENGTKQYTFCGVNSFYNIPTWLNAQSSFISDPTHIPRVFQSTKVFLPNQNYYDL